MKRMSAYQVFLFVIVTLFSSLTFAREWCHSVDVGYGISHDPNHARYNNSGVLLTADLIPICRTSWSFWSINGALGQWYTTAPINKNLTTVAASLALRLYPYDFDSYRSYVLGSVGPAYLSSKWYGENEQAGNFTFQWNGGLGIEFDQFDINMRVSHYSNAYLATPDHGFTVLYLLSIGYLFY